MEQLRKHVTEEIPKQPEKTEENIDRVESCMTVLKTDVRDLCSEITQVKDSADSALENCKSDFSVKIQGVNPTISDIKSSVAEIELILKTIKRKLKLTLAMLQPLFNKKQVQ